jgi:hypothetical protein
LGSDQKTTFHLVVGLAALRFIGRQRKFGGGGVGQGLFPFRWGSAKADDPLFLRHFTFLNKKFPPWLEKFQGQTIA